MQIVHLYSHLKGYEFIIGKLSYSPVDLNSAMHAGFSFRGWKESRTSYWVTSDARLIRQGRGVPAVPLVLVGVDA